MIAPQAAWIACRFVHDTALVFLWGSCVYLAVGMPWLLAAEIAKRLKPAFLGAIVLALITAIVSLPVQTALIGNGWGDAVDRDMLWLVLTLTGIGSAALVQAAGACLLLVIVALPQERGAPLAAVSGAVLAGLSLTGHAAMHGGAIGILHRLNDAVHVLSGGAWLGGLVPFLLAMTRVTDPAMREQALVALRRFSRIGHGAVALVLLTGVANTLLVPGHLPLDWGSPYQAKLALKIVVVAAMTALAITNRYFFVPRLRGGEGATWRALQLAALSEIGLGVAAIALVAALGTEDPG